MSDKLVEQDDVSVDKVKEQAIAKHNSDIDVMQRLIYALNEYIIRFGRTSNIHNECMDLKTQVTKNKEHLEHWVDKI